RYTLVYGLRVISEGTLPGVNQATLNPAASSSAGLRPPTLRGTISPAARGVRDGSSAGLTLHTFDGTIPQLRRSLDRSLDAFFDLLPGAADEDIERFGE